MQVIMSHVNTDFDALASMFAAKKLYPDAQVVISDKQNIPVRQFLTIYRDTLDLVQDNTIDWSEVTELILVDVASLSRIGQHARQLHEENVKMTVYDHHPSSDGDVKSDEGIIEQVGATVTLFIEEIMERRLKISSFEATLFGLGIYTDTSSFTNQGTTSRDFQAASFLMKQGMNLEIIQRFSDQMLSREQQEILNDLFLKANTYNIEGLQIIVSSYHYETFQGGLATLTEKLLDISGADAVLTVVGMNKHIFVVGRATSDRITLLPVLKKWNGGGHEQAGSATIKHGNREDILQNVTDHLKDMLKPAVTAQQMMASPVKTISPNTKIEEAGRLMYRYGHSGYPVVENGELLGMVTRRDLDKANHHGLGHAPVKAYMSTNIVSMGPKTTLEEIQKLIIEHNIGRIPVIEDGKLLGIVTRTNIIEVMHNLTGKEDENEPSEEEVQHDLQIEMKKQLPEEIYTLLKNISKTADQTQMFVYLIGGIVRDLFLNEPNDDVDIVVEGDGITFAKKLAEDYGGEVIVHESFGTATWVHPTDFKVDVTSSRLEYYERPGSLPDVETSTLKEDLDRRDFTINAMAIRLNGDTFGQLVDPYRGQVDLQDKSIKTLHNLSFIEDPTRILRAVRFETRFQFLMDEQTEKLALHSMESMKDLSVKRIIDEMKRIFTEENRVNAIERLYELTFWQQFGVDEASAKQSSAHARQIETMYRRSESFLPDGPHWFNYFLIPFYYGGSLATVKPFALLKQHVKLIQEIASLKELTVWKTLKSKGECHPYLKQYSDEAILFSLARNEFMNQHLIIQYLQQRSDLEMYLTGEDLINEGLKPGATFSKILLQLEMEILNEKVTSKDEALIWLQKEIVTKES